MLEEQHLPEGITVRFMGHGMKRHSTKDYLKDCNFFQLVLYTFTAGIFLCLLRTNCW